MTDGSKLWNPMFSFLDFFVLLSVTAQIKTGRMRELIYLSVRGTPKIDKLKPNKNTHTHKNSTMTVLWL